MLEEPLKLQENIDSVMEECMDEHFLERGNKSERKLRSCKDERMNAKLKFFNDCLNMKLVPTYVSKKVVGWLLHIIIR